MGGIRVKHICNKCGTIAIWTEQIGDSFRCPKCGGNSFTFAGLMKLEVGLEITPANEAERHCPQCGGPGLPEIPTNVPLSSIIEVDFVCGDNHRWPVEILRPSPGRSGGR